MIKKIALFFFVFPIGLYPMTSLIRGTLVVNELGFEANYALSRLPDGEYLMRMTPKNSTPGCSFRVMKISAPQMLRGRMGSIFTNRPPRCLFLLNEKKMAKFWNSIVLIDFRYSFSPDISTLQGTALLSSKKKTYKASLVFD